MSYLARVTYTGNGSTTGYAIPFTYITSSHIYAYLDGVNTTAFSVSGATLTFDSAPANAVVITIKRITPTDARLVDFTDGSVLTEQELDQSADQNFYITQEVHDTNQTQLTLTDADVWDAKSKRIINVADPTAAQDAVTKNYLQTTATDLVNDTTPQLGGDLDLNGKNIDFPTTANISDVLDEDNMASDSATKLATQQSIKAYVDAVTPLSLLDEDDMATDSATNPASQQSIKAYVDGKSHLSLIDEDNFATDSATRPPSQQSVKAYVDTQILTKDNTDEITEGATNLYFTNTRADARITNALIDEDDMATDSATKLPSQQSVKAYVDGKAHLSLIDEDDMSTDSATRPPSQQSVKAYVDGQTHLSLIDEDNMATDSATRPPSQQSVKAYVDGQAHSSVTASSTTTFTNKTIDANGTGNSITNLEVADLASGVLDTDITSVSGSDDTLASAKAIKTYVDAQAHLSLIDEDNFATDSATRPPSQQSVKAYVDGQTHLSLIDEDNMATDSATRPPSQQSVKAYVDGQTHDSGIDDIVEDTTPQLGGDLDLNGNSIDFPTTANISDCLDEDTMSSNSATKLATQQSIKAYVDAQTHLSLIDEDNMATDSATRPPSQQSVKAYADTKASTGDIVSLAIALG